MALNWAIWAVWAKAGKRKTRVRHDKVKKWVIDVL